MAIWVVLHGFWGWAAYAAFFCGPPNGPRSKLCCDLTALFLLRGEGAWTVPYVLSFIWLHRELAYYVLRRPSPRWDLAGGECSGRCDCVFLVGALPWCSWTGPIGPIPVWWNPVCTWECAGSNQLLSYGWDCYVSILLLGTLVRKSPDRRALP